MYMTYGKDKPTFMIKRSSKNQIQETINKSDNTSTNNNKKLKDVHEKTVRERPQLTFIVKWLKLWLIVSCNLFLNANATSLSNSHLPVDFSKLIDLHLMFPKHRKTHDFRVVPWNTSIGLRSKVTLNISTKRAMRRPWLSSWMYVEFEALNFGSSSAFSRMLGWRRQKVEKAKMAIASNLLAAIISR